MTRTQVNGTVMAVIASGLFSLPQSVFAGGVATQIGVTDLQNRLGVTTPTGAGVVVGQVEASESAGNWGPNTAHAEFTGKSFLTAPNSPAGPGSSGHATFVGLNYYGNSSGGGPGITTIYRYEATAWALGSFLRTNAAQPATLPLTPPGSLKIYNNSWVGSFGTANEPSNIDALRRADFAVTTHDLLIVSGVNNGPNPQLPLMCHMFNGVHVGLANGGHTAGLTSATYDGPGRNTVHIVAPEGVTSFATSLVSGVSARLVQTALTAPLSSNTNARRAEVIKAALLAGANHRAGWNNCTGGCASGVSRGLTASPLDPVYGVDVVNANRSHLILSGAEQDGSASPPTSVNVKWRGWDRASVATGTSRYYRFRIASVADEISVVAVWNRIITSFTNAGISPNFNLMLKRVDGSGNLVDLVGNAGLAYFSSGNVVSQSTVENIEHLYIRNLQPGEYAIQLQRIDGDATARDVAVAWLLPKRIGDINEDSSVGVPDLLAVIAAWGACPTPCPPTCPADLNGDCNVGVPDLLTVISNWG